MPRRERVWAFPGSPGPSPCSLWTGGRPELRFLPHRFWNWLRWAGERVRRGHRAEAWATVLLDDGVAWGGPGWPGPPSLLREVRTPGFQVESLPP